MSEHQNKGRKKKVGEKENNLRSQKTNCSLNTSHKSSFILYAACSGFHEKNLPHCFPVGNGNTDFNAAGKSESARSSTARMPTGCCLLAQSFDRPSRGLQPLLPG